MMWLVVAIGVVLAVAAAAAAWLITYQEYARRFPLDRRPAVRASVEAAVVAFLIFAGLATALGWILPRMLPAG